MQGFGDHLGTFMTLNKNLKKPKSKKIKSFKKYDPESFLTKLKEKLDSTNIKESAD